MSVPNTGACPYGASPNSAGTTAQNIWVDLTTYGQSLITEWQRIMPWIKGAIPTRFVSVIELCQMNPNPPAPLTPDDFKVNALDVWAGGALPPGVMNKVWQQLYYDAFVNLCQCNPFVGDCVVYDIAGSTSTNMYYSTQAQGYNWPTSNHGIGTNPIVVPLELSFNCPTIDLFVDTNPHIPNLVINPLHIYDGAGVDHGLVTQAGSTTRVTLSNIPNDSQHTSINLIICTFDNGGRPNWTIKITPVGGGSGGSTPPAQPANQTGGMPTPPALQCDATGACTVQWGIVNQLNTNIYLGSTTNTNVIEGTATSYMEGESYLVTGQGVQQVASGTLGLLVDLSVIPSSIVPTPTEPPRYYDVGYIQMGLGDAVDGKKWIHSSGDRFMPAFPGIDRFWFNLSPGVSITATELVPPPSTSPTSSSSPS